MDDRDMPNRENAGSGREEELTGENRAEGTDSVMDVDISDESGVKENVEVPSVSGESALEADGEATDTTNVGGFSTSAEEGSGVEAESFAANLSGPDLKDVLALAGSLVDGSEEHARLGEIIERIKASGALSLSDIADEGDRKAVLDAAVLAQERDDGAGGKKPKRKLTKRQLVSRIMMSMGVILIVTALMYEAINFPWAILFGTEYGELDDPEPPSEEMLMTLEEEEEFYGSIDEEEPETVGEADTIVSPSGGGSSSKSSRYIHLGVLKISKLKVSVNIYEGTKEQMRIGVGHETWTSDIGTRGNIVIAGHRNYIRMHPFRHLDKLSAGDRVTITANGVTYTYEVYESFVVEPTDVWILDDIEGEEATLTLLTCTPIVQLTHRLIVRCRLVDPDASELGPGKGERTGKQPSIGEEKSGGDTEGPEEGVDPEESIDPGELEGDDDGQAYIPPPQPIIRTSPGETDGDDSANEADPAASGDAAE